jgi:farnesyl-diphosphate farnesyltransferase
MPLDLLRQVSRTFYLSLAVLPRPLRHPLGLAYLLARAADTIADTRLLARGDRLRRLEALRVAIATGRSDAASPIGAPALAHVAAAQATRAERQLLLRLPECLRELDRLEPADATRVRTVLATLTGGMIFDLTRFHGDDATVVTALASLDDLDHYTYLVAGCVGEFWTEMHVAHRRRLAGWNVEVMRARGVRFGKALQMTNLLRDLPRDLRIGRCYLPAPELASLGLGPADLLDPAIAPRVRPLYDRLLRVTLDHYAVAWQYTLAIPAADVRTRLACAWPLLIGLGTLELLARSPHILDPDRRIRLSRAAVRGILARSAVLVWSDRGLAGSVERWRRRIAV